MSFNTLSYLSTCYDFVNNVAPLSLVYYSHFITAATALILGFVVLRYSKPAILGSSLFLISTCFSIWVIFDLITWTSYDSVHYMFFWSFFGILTSLLYLSCIYFSYVFINKKTPPFSWLVFFFILLLPILLLTPTATNLVNFDVYNCIASEDSYFTNYFHSLGILAFVLILYLLYSGCKIYTGVLRKQIILMTLGIEAFILVFFTATFLDSYFVNVGVTGDYTLGNYGLFGMPIFIAFLSFLIVKFKAFNIKLIGTQAIVWALVILIGSQFFFIQNKTNMVLTGFTLLISSILGYYLVRSVKAEVALREQLQVANKNQENLIRFITHQVKGFFTKSKGIFAMILEGDLGPVSKDLEHMSREGIRFDSQAVDMIQDVLNASNLKTGRTTYSMERLSLLSIIQNLVLIYKPQFEDKGLAFEVNLPTEEICIKADKNQITQVYKNILDNALRYTVKGSVSLSLSADRHNTTYTVTDTGIGLSESDRAKLFSEGGRGEESLKYNVNSTGFGLYIAKNILTDHGGTMTATSKGRGHGSTFTITLPLCE